MGFWYYGGSAPIFQADFSAFSLGGVSAGTFLSATGLTFTRASGSTVQTSPSSLVSGLGNDVACIGDRTGSARGLVIQNTTFNGVGVVAGAASPRNLFTEWAAGSGVTTQTFPYADSPDGTGSGCSRVAISSGGYAPFGNSATSARLTFSSWQRSTNAASDGDMQHVWITAVPGDGLNAVRLASNTWARLVLVGGGVARQYLDVCDGRDYTGSGGQTARARDVLVDYIMYESGDFPTEAIPTALTRRRSDRVTYATGSNLVVGGRIKCHQKFYPKFASTMDVSYNGLSFAGFALHWYLWSYGAGSGAYGYARIVASNKKLEVKVGAETFTSTNSISFAQYDEVDIYIEAGGNVASVAKYRLNGGAWVDLVLTTFTQNVVPSGAIGFFHNDAVDDNADSGQLPCWWKSLAVYGGVGLSV